MRIKKHRLEGEKVNCIESPNCGGNFSQTQLDTIVMHYTAGSSADSAIRTLCNPKIKASAHLVIARDGSITQLVPFDTITWHAGKSSYNGRSGFNKYSIGIEIDNAGRLTESGSGYKAWFGKVYPKEQVVKAVHRNESAESFWHEYTEEQINAVHNICSLLMENYNITNILGHEEIAPKRKSDPGPAFPLDKLRNNLLFNDRSQNHEDEHDLKDMREAKSIGIVMPDKLNIRSASFASAPLAAQPLEKGTVVNILREKGEWYEIDVKLKGWVKADYIKT